MSDDGDDRAPDRLAAHTLMPIMMEAFHTGLREAGSLSRWLLATLAFISGAAAVAVLRLDIGTAAKLGATIAFVFGILAALGAGLWSLFVFKRVASLALTMLGYWITVADDGERIEALETTMKAEMDEILGSRATYVLLFAGVAAFLLGCAMAGWGLWSRGAA
jgi:glucan phosphoethanolaminetransferase (alkaline phosphatase superfamily)